MFLRNWPRTRVGFACAIFVPLAMTVAMALVLRHGYTLRVLAETLLHVMMAAVMIGSYYGGKHVVSSMSLKPSADYVWVYCVTCLLVLSLWAGHGSDRDWDFRSNQLTLIRQ